MGTKLKRKGPTHIVKIRAKASSCSPAAILHVARRFWHLCSWFCSFTALIFLTLLINMLLFHVELNYKIGNKRKFFPNFINVHVFQQYFLNFCSFFCSLFCRSIAPLCTKFWWFVSNFEVKFLLLMKLIFFFLYFFPIFLFFVGNFKVLVLI